VFHRACAHAVALLREQAARAGGAGEHGLAAWEAVCALDPDEPQHLADAMDAAFAADKPREATALAGRLLAHPKRSAALRARAELLLGDLALLARDNEGALTHYRVAIALPLDEALARLTTVKMQLASAATVNEGVLTHSGVNEGVLTHSRVNEGALTHSGVNEGALTHSGVNEGALTHSAAPLTPEERAALIRFLVAPAAGRDPAFDLMTLRQLTDAKPDAALPHYLLGRQLLARERWAEALAELTHPVRDHLPDARFDRESLRMRAITLFRLGRIAESRAAFSELAHAAGAPEGARLDAADWVERCDFAERGRL
jgi:tetratricopeptide (TPR) repeat protein